ncbi:MAG: hypothetical protein WBJ41_06900 [Chromatiaceae bacterium]
MTMDSAWVRQGECHWVGPGKTQVCAVRVRDGWVYVAWSGPASPELKYWDWVKQVDFRIWYGRGEMIPQRRRLLGRFATAAEARAACQRANVALGEIRVGVWLARPLRGS